MNLRETRISAGLRQVDVAKKMNITQGAVSLWETFNRVPRKYHKKLAKLYNVTVDELLGKKEE